MKQVVLVLSSPYVLSDDEAALLDLYIETFLNDSFVGHHASFKQASTMVARLKPHLVVFVGTYAQNPEIARVCTAIENEPDVDPDVEIDILFVEEIRQFKAPPVLDCEQSTGPLKPWRYPELPEKHGLQDHPNGVMIDMFDRADPQNKIN